MKYLPLIWAGLWRSPTRTTLTFLSIACAFLLIGSLYGVDAGFNEAIHRISAKRLRVGSADGSRAMPIVYRQRIQQIPHVVSTMIVTQISGYYQQPENLLWVNAIGGDVDLTVFGPIYDAAKLKSALAGTRTGLVVGRQLSQQFGWKIGDRVPLISGTLRHDGSGVWEFDVVGIYDVPSAPDTAKAFIFNYDYLEEARAEGQGVTNQLFIDTDSADHNLEVARAIDQQFAMSDLATATSNERDAKLAAATATFDFRIVIATVGIASLIALLIVSATTMAQSVKQRLHELALMKALGFLHLRIASVIVGEALCLSLSAAIVGLSISVLVYPKVAAIVQAPAIRMPMHAPIACLGIAAVVALLSAAMPIVSLRRLTVAQALAQRA
jgi:putative ABC transport system permease protein